MKAAIKYGYRSLWIALTGILLTACDAASEPDLSVDSESIRIYTSMQQAHGEETTAPVGENMTSRLIFWKESVYKSIINDTWPTTPPYLVAKPEYPIDYYAVEYGNPYDTKRSYPIGNEKVHVIGYAPAELESNNNYQTLTIPEAMQNGKVDFLSGDGNQHRVGSAAEPFVTGLDEEAKKRKQLQFCHLTAKINFEASRAETMAQKIGVQNVKVTLKGQRVPTSLTWECINKDNQEGGYLPVQPTDKEIYLTAPKDEKIMLYNNQKVDSCYVYAEGSHFHAPAAQQKEDKITLKMDISAELLPFKDKDWDVSQMTKREWKDQTVTIDSKTGDALKMGYAYKVIITFDVWDIRLQGMEVDWDSGGKHYIPITPVESEVEQPKE